MTKNTIICGVCCLVTALHVFGCDSKNSTPNGTEDGVNSESSTSRSDEGPQFVRCEITVFEGEARRTVEVKDRKKIDQLISFFPEAGQGKEPPHSTGWVAHSELNFVSDDGSPLNITISDPMEFWAEADGGGDWPLSKDFAPFFQQVIKP